MRAVVFSENSQQLFSASDDASIKKWDLKTKAVFNSFPGHDDRVLCLSLSGGLLASDSNEKIIIHNTEDGSIAREVAAHSDYIRTMEFSRDGLMLASGS